MNVYVWKGALSSLHDRNQSKQIANLFVARHTAAGINTKAPSPSQIIEIEEGQESEEFWNLLGGRSSTYMDQSFYQKVINEEDE